MQVRSAEKKLHNFVDEIFTTDFVDNPLINDLTPADERKIRESASAKHIQVKIDRQPLNQIQLCGELTKVQEVKLVIIKMLLEMEKKASMLREATQLIQRITWKRVGSGDVEEYDMMTNYEIEQAYLTNPNGSYTQGDAGAGSVHFTINFKKMQEKDHVTKSKSEVVREDILNKGNI